MRAPRPSRAIAIAWLALAPLAPALAEEPAPALAEEPAAALAEEPAAALAEEPAPEPAAAAPADSGPHDPWEPMNRKIFAFNDFLSRWTLEPLGRGWACVVPEFARRSIERAYANLRTPIVMVNDLLQVKPGAAGVDLGRFLLNSTVGLAGLLDPARAIGLEPNHEDFGQTLGYWGVPPGPYLVIPILGPSSPRDAVGTAVDTAAFAVSYFIPFWVSATTRGVDFANTFSFVADDIEDERAASFDWYAAVRNAHVSNRENLVRDRTETVEQQDEEDELYFPEDELEE